MLSKVYLKVAFIALSTAVLVEEKCFTEEAG